MTRYEKLAANYLAMNTNARSFRLTATATDLRAISHSGSAKAFLSRSRVWGHKSPLFGDLLKIVELAFEGQEGLAADDAGVGDGRRRQAEHERQCRGRADHPALAPFRPMRCLLGVHYSDLPPHSLRERLSTH